MALPDITKKAVLQAVEEFRALGQDAFLEKHGFGKSTRYLLRIDGEDFDSKAIVGVAHGYALPELGPLAYSDFSGGKDAAAGKLESLGFQIAETDTLTVEIFSRKSFERAFTQFEKNLQDYNGSSFSGFDSGVIAHWESYKTEIREIALMRLRSEKWDIDDVGSGHILSSLINSIEIREGAKLHNNLVAWEARPNQPSLTLQLRQDVGQGNNRQQFERAIFDLFHKHAGHKGSLERIVELVGRRYSLIAYIFFLIDDARYMPIAPRTFDQAFADLGFEVRMSGNCSWDNYTAYNDAIRKIQQAFVDWKGMPETRLVDAHSWIWMMARLPGTLEQLQRQGVRKPDDVKFKMIALGRSIISRVATSNGQSEERVVKNKELFGFTSDQALYAFLNDLWKLQEGRCNLTGLPMVLNVPKGEPNDMIVSVDRIDSDAQYSPENLQLTCWFANRWKGATPNDQFIKLLNVVRNGDKDAAESTEFVAEEVVLPASLQAK